MAQITAERRAISAPSCGVAAIQVLVAGTPALAPLAGHGGLHVMHLLGIRPPHAHLLGVAAGVVARTLCALQLDPPAIASRGTIGERLAITLDRGSAAAAAEIVKGGEWAASALESFGRTLIKTRVPRVLTRANIHPSIVHRVKEMEMLSMEVSEKVSEASGKVSEHRDRFLACVARRMENASKQNRTRELVTAAVVVGSACAAMARLCGACDEASASIIGSACVVGIELVRHSVGEEAGVLAKDIVTACERVRDARWAVEEIVDVDLVRPHLLRKCLAKSTALQVFDGVHKLTDINGEASANARPAGLRRSPTLLSDDLSSICTSRRGSDASESPWQTSNPLDSSTERKLPRSPSSQLLDSSWTSEDLSWACQEEGAQPVLDEVLCLALPPLTTIRHAFR